MYLRLGDDRIAHIGGSRLAGQNPDPSQLTFRLGRLGGGRLGEDVVVEGSYARLGSGAPEVYHSGGNISATSTLSGSGHTLRDNSGVITATSSGSFTGSGTGNGSLLDTTSGSFTGHTDRDSGGALTGVGSGTVVGRLVYTGSGLLSGATALAGGGHSIRNPHQLGQIQAVSRATLVGIAERHAFGALRALTAMSGSGHAPFQVATVQVGALSESRWRVGALSDSRWQVGELR